MRSRRRVALPGMLALCALTGASTANSQDVVDSYRALDDARVQSHQASIRAELLEKQASRANAAADRTAQDTAIIAARIQQAEAEVAGKEAQIRLITAQSDGLRANLAAHQQPLVRLAAALQLLARRPIVLALFRPGSVMDTVHTRALIESMIPEVQHRTAVLRVEIAQSDTLQRQLDQARLALRTGKNILAARRRTLAAVETQQRLAARDVNGNADHEAERALAMSEQARDLGSLVDILGKQNLLRARLAALPGPVMRPERAGQILSHAGEAGASLVRPTSAPFAGYMLPLAGRLVAGFGDVWRGGRSRGISIAAQDGEQAIAPAAGRVAFAGPYRGYGQIVIITHDDRWISLITGLARVDVRVGDALVGGAPLGVAGPGRPVLTVELQHDGKPVNPLDYVRR